MRTPGAPRRCLASPLLDAFQRSSGRRRGAKKAACSNAWQVLLILLVVLSAPTLAKKDGKGPLCHSDFLTLERCLGSDYERLGTDCADVYGKVKTCLRRDWRHIDDARGYKKEDNGFNRMRRCKHGVMLYNPMDWYIGRGLEVYGEWGEKKVQLWEKVVKPGHVAIDVGAHVGTLTLPLSKLVGPAGRVVAFEPFYPSFSTLAANVGVNSLQNVELRQMIVADRIGKVFMNRNSLAFGMQDFFNFGSMNYNSLRIYNNTDDVERPSTEWDEYQVTPLDLLSLSRLDFLKIDAEAMEIMVLEGASRIIKRFKPVIFLEYRNPWEKDTNVLDFLRKKMRYECVLLRVPIFNSDNFRAHAEDIWSGSGGAKIVSFNLLCKHRWWEYPDMNEELLDLFDTAVDTDIEGLRTTAIADPFEAMAQSQAALAREQALHGGAESRGSTAEGAAGSSPMSATSARAPAAGAGRPARKSEELTLEELLDDGDDVLGERSEEISLAELLGPSPPPVSRDSTAGGAGSGAASKPGKQPPPSPSKKSYDEMTLDELLDESFPEGPGKGAADGVAGKKASPVNEDHILDDLLGSASAEPVAAADQRRKAPASSPKAAKAAPVGKGVSSAPAPGQKKKKGEQRPVEELTLDELLDGVGGEGSEEMTLDELLGSSEQDDKSGKRVEEMTLDELLGPEPSSQPGAVGDKPLMDELLGDSVNDKRYEDMSLDELLALDDPVAPTPPAPKPPPKKEPKKTRKPKPEEASKAKAKTQEPAAKPHVKISYDDELTLDEL